ncbi:hypothetical protein DH09_19060 [Bacillaceae bacterium JMAK1]|nr:hypothetical protein DH09_19060 [Bacillaceae bacterium JMAK1]
MRNLYVFTMSKVATLAAGIASTKVISMVKVPTGDGTAYNHLSDYNVVLLISAMIITLLIGAKRKQDAS